MNYTTTKEQNTMALDTDMQGYLTDEVQDCGADVLRKITSLRKELDQAEQSTLAWMNGQSAKSPHIGSQAVQDVVTTITKFRTTAELVAVVL